MSRSPNTTGGIVVTSCGRTLWSSDASDLYRIDTASRDASVAVETGYVLAGLMWDRSPAAKPDSGLCFRGGGSDFSIRYRD